MSREKVLAVLVEAKLLRHQCNIINVYVSSGFQINISTFRDFALDIARNFVQLYPRDYISPTIHNSLIHGPEIINHASLPIRRLTEEAQEAQNKDFRNFREHFS